MVFFGTQPDGVLAIPLILEMTYLSIRWGKDTAHFTNLCLLQPWLRQHSKDPSANILDFALLFIQYTQALYSTEYQWQDSFKVKQLF